MKSMKNPLIASASAALLLGLGSQAAIAENPFSAETLSSGYSQLAHNHSGEKKGDEAKCGEAKCGEEDKDREGESSKEGENKQDKDAEGKCGEGKCGEGKCGA